MRGKPMPDPATGFSDSASPSGLLGGSIDLAMRADPEQPDDITGPMKRDLVGVVRRYVDNVNLWPVAVECVVPQRARQRVQEQ
jgi:hypothetical protein